MQLGGLAWIAPLGAKQTLSELKQQGAGPHVSRLPREDSAAELWDHVVGLAGFPGFAELKRSLRATVSFVNCNYHLYMPNAFSPNNDSLNDIFTGYGTGIIEFEMHIYNRLYIEVFSTNDINIGWDGTFKNNPCMIDTYFWTVTYHLKNETFNRTDKGMVTLLK